MFAPPPLPPQTRNPVWAAEVVSATVKVRLRLGLLRRAVYSLRPGPLWAPALGCAAAAMLLGGGAAALLFLGLLLYTGFGGGAAKAGSSEGAATSSVVSAADEVSSVSGVSEASSSVLRELEAEPAPRGGAEEPLSPHPAAAAAAERVERYLDALPGAGAAGLRARKPGAAPADSAMGSEPGLPRPRAKFA